MPDLIHQFISGRARIAPDSPALLYKDQVLSYTQLLEQVEAVAAGLLDLGLAAGERVAVYLPKQPETVYSLFGAAQAGCCFVPVNPLLKPRQVAHILPHCGVRVMVTSAARLEILAPVVRDCPELHTIVLVDDRIPDVAKEVPQAIIRFNELDVPPARRKHPHRVIDSDMAAILYTSGSTGKPKGVILSHRNMVAGAQSVASYQGIVPGDRLLALLPLSFDAGLSQLTTAFCAGASVALMEYLLPSHVLSAVTRYGVTGITAVPPLWNQLRELEWPAQAAQSLRFIANTGGAMPVATTRALREKLPSTLVFLMYGLTESFRSTYLPPDQVDIRPESIGKAIPNAEVLVIDKEGKECGPDQPGELVHRGALVSLGYWDDPEQTAERFRPCPLRPGEIPTTELAVWSGDEVVKDAEGYLYFIGRSDDMIKTSGYRVSPFEVEEVAFASGRVTAAAALGLPHAALGQAILLLVTPAAGVDLDNALEAGILDDCRRELPNFMVPLAVLGRSALPHNQNGKIDLRALAEEYRDIFQDASP